MLNWSPKTINEEVVDSFIRAVGWTDRLIKLRLKPPDITDDEKKDCSLLVQFCKLNQNFLVQVTNLNRQ
jgi:hypothetical protein